MTDCRTQEPVVLRHSICAGLMEDDASLDMLRTDQQHVPCAPRCTPGDARLGGEQESQAPYGTRNCVGQALMYPVVMPGRVMTRTGAGALRELGAHRGQQGGA